MSVQPPPDPSPTGLAPVDRGTSGRSIGPSPMTAFVAIYRLLLRTMATPGRLAAVGALAGVSVFTALIVHANDPTDPLREGTGWVTANLSSLVAVGVLVFAVAALGDPQEDGTLLYLWLRPVPSWIPVLAAWCATVTVTVPLVGLPVLLSAAVIHTDGGLLLGTALSVGVSIIAYAAIFVMAGVRFRRALPWGLAYILIWEGFVASAGAGAARLAVRTYARSILAELTDVRIRHAGYALGTGMVVPVIVAVVALTYAAHRLARTDVA